MSGYSSSKTFLKGNAWFSRIQTAGKPFGFPVTVFNSGKAFCICRSRLKQQESFLDFPGPIPNTGNCFWNFMIPSHIAGKGQVIPNHA